MSWKLFRDVLGPFQESYVELAWFLGFFLLVAPVAALRRGRQAARVAVRALSILLFFAIVSTCLGVFGLIRNAYAGLLLIGEDDLNAFHGLGLTVAVLATARNLGPVFCGWICPTGALQDAAAWIARRAKGALRGRRAGEGAARPAARRARAGAAVAVAGAFAAYLGLVGRSFAARRPLVEDAAVLWASALAALVLWALLHPAADRALRPFRLVSLALILALTALGFAVYSPVHFIFVNVHDRASLLSTLAIIAAAAAIPRAWCRYLCPFGVLCSAVGRAADRRIVRGDACASCGACDRACPVRCIERGRIRRGECTACLRCVDLCPHGALAWVEVEPARGGRGRRARRAAAAVLALAFVLAPAAAGAPDEGLLWPSARGGPANAAYRDFPACRGGRGWIFRPARVAYPYRRGTSIWSSPALVEVGGRVLLLCGSYDRNVYAVDAATGEPMWRFTTGGGVYDTPAVAFAGGRTLCVFGSSDRVLYGLDAATGEKLWGRALIPFRPTVGPAAVRTPVFFRTPGGLRLAVAFHVHDRAPGRPIEAAELRVYDPVGPRRIWARRFSASEPTNPIAVARGGRTRIALGCRDGNLYCFDAAAGDLIWKALFRGEIAGGPAAVDLEDRTLLVCGSRYSVLRAFDLEDGREVWRLATGRWIDGAPAVDARRGVIYIGSYDQALYAVDAATGGRLWRFETAGEIYGSPALLPRGEATLVAVVSGDDHLYLVDGASGREVRRWALGRFRYPLRISGDSSWASPVAARLGGRAFLFHPHYDGILYAWPLDGSGPRRPGGVPGYGRAMILRAVGAAAAAALLAGLLVARARRREARRCGGAAPRGEA